jgi:filamentous hemagglutinin family protein
MNFFNLARLKKPSLLTLGALFVSFCFSVAAFSQELPQGGNVISGHAELDYISQPNTLNINIASDRAIIEWQSFSIGTANTVNFNRSSSFVALNRVIGLEPSIINGNLNAPNGQIILTNPNGISFGSQSRVNVAGLIASTLDIDNADFLAGKYDFHKVSTKNAYVVNRGVLSTTHPGGYICLLSGAVDNQNVVVADLGTVVLAAGEKMTIALDNNGVISVVVDEAVKDVVLGPDGRKIESAIKNSGTLKASGGKVIINAKVLNNVFDYAINNTGIIQANNVLEHDGVIELTAQGAPVINTGTIEAGKVKIALADDAFINQGIIKSNGSELLPNAGAIKISAKIILQSGLINANAYEAGSAGNIEIISERGVSYSRYG